MQTNFERFWKSDLSVPIETHLFDQDARSFTATSEAFFSVVLAGYVTDELYVGPSQSVHQGWKDMLQLSQQCADLWSEVFIVFGISAEPLPVFFNPHFI